MNAPFSTAHEPAGINLHQAAEKAPDYSPLSPVRSASLFRNGANQAVRIPKEFELFPGLVSIQKVGNTLVLQPMSQVPSRGTVAALVAALESMKDWPVITEPFPDVDEGLAPLDEIEL